MNPYLYEIPFRRFLIFVVIFLMAFDNTSFIRQASMLYEGNFTDMLFMGSLVFLFGALTLILLSLLCYRHTTKPVIMVVLVSSAFAAYFMDSYGSMLTTKMMSTLLETNFAEASDLLSVKMLVYVVFLGILPAWLVFKTRIVFLPWRSAIWSRIKLLSTSFILMIVVLFSFSDYYFSFFREHKSVRYYSNPGAYLYSSARLVYDEFDSEPTVVKAVGEDAQIPAEDDHRELVIMVVGETTRADHFSLNDYSRETNPYTRNIDNIISFTNFWSCGTLTAVSVPCMFSNALASDYEKKQALSNENVLDVLVHAGVNVLWLDNNSSSKGMAKRVEHIDYRDPKTNPVCDIECRDVGMLAKLQSYIDSHPKGDIFIVLHQMGQHGPAYYKRYPTEFEVFAPSCKSNQLQECGKDEIANAYDNSIVYTDYFLSQVIGMLKVNSSEFETAMFYVSDHGESLGENGLYLHGLPNLVAPEEQRHVPAVMWIGESMDDIDVSVLKRKQANNYSHDNVFHTILGFMEITSDVYRQELDILHDKHTSISLAKGS
jgi:lipid A ethanolaminephosphotransferase